MGIFLLYILVRSGSKKLVCTILALSLGTAAGFYILPVLFEIDDIQMGNTRQVDYAAPADNPTPLSDLFVLPSMFDTGIENDWMGGSLGLPQIAALLVIWLQTRSATFVWRAFPALDVF